jgi:prepilin-type N-terminal cleavage/methylation domain-containing protein
VKKSRAQSGFSLIEAMVVVAIIVILAGVAIIQIAPALKTAKSNTALQSALGVMRRYHQAAVDQRRIYRISFIAPRTIQVDQVSFDTNGNQVFTFVSSTDLPVETQFLCISGIPTTTGTTPDGLGTGQNPIDFSLDYGGGGTTVFFQKDGRSTDSAGRLNSGVIYMAQPGDLSSSKAITVLGATGRVKGWRLFTSGGKSDWRAL